MDRSEETTARPDTRRRLLVVEDNPLTLKLLLRILEDEYDVDTAQSVDESIEKTRAHHYDAFVLDINLGERRTGVEVLHEIRRMPEYDAVPAIACTAYALQNQQAFFREAGFTDVVTKPVTKSSLLEGIEQAIAHPSPQPKPGEIMAEAIELPPLPTTVIEVSDLVARAPKETDFETLISIARRDQVVSTWLLQRVNSAYFSLNADVDSVERAIQYMGLRPVCNLLLGKFLTQEFSTFDTPRTNHVYHYIMQMGLGAAFLARALAEHVEHPHPENAYSGALLCQLGRLLLLDDREEQYASLWYDEEGAFAGPPSLGQETLALSINYVMLGIEVGRRSKLPDGLSTVLRYHRRPRDVFDKKQQPLVLLVAAGLEVSQAMRASDDAENPHASALLSVLYESHLIKEIARRRGADRRDLIFFIQDTCEEARTFVAEILTEEE